MTMMKMKMAKKKKRSKIVEADSQQMAATANKQNKRKGKPIKFSNAQPVWSESFYDFNLILSINKK